MAKAILFDSSICTACRGCQVACKQWNKLVAEKTSNRGTHENPPDLSPDTWLKIKFTEVDKSGSVQWLYTRQACMHCTDAACEELCPSNAIYRNELGFIEINPKRCIGCGVCEKFCPFKVPHVDDEKNKAAKCWLCWNRVANGLIPACVKTCPTGALKFGDRGELLNHAHQIMAQSSNGRMHLYGETELGGLNVLYLLPEALIDYSGLPKNPQVPDPFEAYAFLEKKLKSSPIKDKVLTAAGLKYFGHIYV